MSATTLDSHASKSQGMTTKELTFGGAQKKRGLPPLHTHGDAWPFWLAPLTRTPDEAIEPLMPPLLVPRFTLLLIAGLFLVMSSSCKASHHERTLPSPGHFSSSSAATPPSTRAWQAVLATPGELTLERITLADWRIDRSGVIDLDHPRASSLEEGLEPIHIYLQVLEHPVHGTFLIDFGVAHAFSSPETNPVHSSLLAHTLNLDQLEVHHSTKQWLEDHPRIAIQGVFLTHMHLDHVMGVPDLAPHTPLFASPHETDETRLEHFFTQDVIDAMLEGKPPILTWRFAPDRAHLFEGVQDVFGDGQMFALRTPGHTAGHTSYLVRTRGGPILLTGDVAHTAWGWEHCVAAGSYNKDRARGQRSFEQLKHLEELVPELTTWPGHQSLEASRSPSNTCKTATREKP